MTKNYSFLFLHTLTTNLLEWAARWRSMRVKDTMFIMSARRAAKVGTVDPEHMRNYKALVNCASRTSMRGGAFGIEGMFFLLGLSRFGMPGIGR